MACASGVNHFDRAQVHVFIVFNKDLDFLYYLMMKLIISADTPLSALIRENHFDELTFFLEKWGLCLKGDNSNNDVLKMSYFEFDFDRINVGTIYRNLAQLVAHDAVIPDVTVLARYITDHSNIVVKWTSVYRQINRYLGFYK